MAKSSAKGRPRKPLAEVLLGAPRCAPLRLPYPYAPSVPLVKSLKIHKPAASMFVGFALRRERITPQPFMLYRQRSRASVENFRLSELTVRRTPEPRESARILPIFLPSFSDPLLPKSAAKNYVILHATRIQKARSRERASKGSPGFATSVIILEQAHPPQPTCALSSAG
jgi:hypothetical protein